MTNVLEALLRRLAALPPSSEIQELRQRVEDCRRHAHSWQYIRPKHDERETLVRDVRGLHVAVERLERR